MEDCFINLVRFFLCRITFGKLNTSTHCKFLFIFIHEAHYSNLFILINKLPQTFLHGRLSKYPCRNIVVHGC